MMRMFKVALANGVFWYFFVAEWDYFLWCVADLPSVLCFLLEGGNVSFIECVAEICCVYAVVMRCCGVGGGCSGELVSIVRCDHRRTTELRGDCVKPRRLVLKVVHSNRKGTIRTLHRLGISR